MSGPKVLVVARRFWPFTDDASQRLLQQCSAMARAGLDITVVTGRWHPHWPSYSVCREVPVHRLLPAPNSNWNEGHFQKNLVSWITKSTKKFDCLYVDRADGLVLTLQSKCQKWEVPLLCRYSPDDSGYGLSSGQKITPLAMADACRRAARIVCPTPNAHRLLVSQGIQESKIVRISDVAWEPVQKTVERRLAASNALFDTSSDFLIPGRSQLLLHLGLSEAAPLRMAIQAVADLLDTGMLLRMWVIGSGVEPSVLYDLIKSRGWHREILLFDGFDDLLELIQVADLCIASNSKETIQYTLPLMASGGVATMISDNQDCRAWLPEGNHFQLYSTEQSLAHKLNDWIANRERWTSMANALRQHLNRGHSREACVQKWLSLFRDSLTDRNA